MNLIYDEAADALLRDNEFIGRWKSLHSNCRYATAFQEPAFVCSWYEAYRNEWKPLLIYDENSAHELSGLLMLAYKPNARELVHAGGSQAEYQSWLSLPGEEVSFLSKAIHDLFREYHVKKLQFRYFPGVEGVNEVISKLPMGANIAVRKRPRPLMILDAEEIKASFAKKSNKSRFNRLKKLGKIDFYRIRDVRTLESVFDELILFYDLRQGAVNLSCPFHEDKNKRKFHIDLLHKGGDNVYVTVTCLNDRPIAGFWGLASKTTMHLGMVMHSPFLAEHSIGKLHLMQLSEQLLHDNFDTLDLTPGSDPWKERFANAHDEVAEIIVYPSAFAKRKGEMTYGILNQIRRKANQYGITTARLKAMLSQARNSGIAIFLDSFRWIRSDRKFVIYQTDRSSAADFQRDDRFRCNSLNDLLLFRSNQKGLTENSFLSNALLRLEQREQVYTMNADDQLVYCSWVKHNQEEAEAIFQPESVTIHDIYIAGNTDKGNLFQRSIAHISKEALADEKVKIVYAVLPAGENVYGKLAEEMGFVKKSYLVIRSRFGKQEIKHIVN